MRFISIAAAAACLIVSAAVAPVAAVEPTPSDRPNIVMFYIDDTPPHDGSLWDDPARTPSIYDNFIAHGVDFDRAIGEDPLCCPARGNMLTGLHTHNNRVVTNNALLFDPSVQIGKSMREAGYASMFIGKYLNRDGDLTPEQWAQHDAGWTDLDVIKGINGDFYNFILHTKTGEFRVKGLHSTQMVGDRAVMHFRETPADTPLFAILSIFNLHGPNTPLKEFIGDPRCASMPPWNPPNYNEADVTDKPAAIQALPLQAYPDGWPMVKYCEEMLGVDKIVGQVTDELEAEGRLDNTLLVFTADNGMAWGQHRLGQVKQWPYTTPVPLYMRWADGHWGDTPVVNHEIVSNIDYAPTFCDLAQTCQLGPFARGNLAPDGVSLVPLLDGDVDNLGRDAVLEESYIPGGFNWSGLRTTELFDATDRWHYVEYLDGFRELYDLVGDPWELDNLAADPDYADLIGTLHERLGELRLEGITAGTGSLSIVEDANPDSGADQPFTGDLGDFTLDDDADGTYSNTKSWPSLASGAYTIKRTSGSPPTGINCTGVAPYDRASQKVTIYLHPSESITCTFVDQAVAPPPPARPDASIAFSEEGTYKGDNLYEAVPTLAQTRKRTGLRAGHTYWYWVSLQNDSPADDSLIVGATRTGPTKMRVAYFVAGVDVTSQVIAGTYSVPEMESGAVAKMAVRVIVGRRTPQNTPLRLVISAHSESSAALVDTVKAVAVR